MYFVMLVIISRNASEERDVEIVLRGRIDLAAGPHERRDLVLRLLEGVFGLHRGDDLVVVVLARMILLERRMRDDGEVVADASDEAPPGQHRSDHLVLVVPDADPFPDRVHVREEILRRPESEDDDAPAALDVAPP